MYFRIEYVRKANKADLFDIYYLFIYHSARWLAPNLIYIFIDKPAQFHCTVFIVRI
jgi:hypothetical protein